MSFFDSIADEGFQARRNQRPLWTLDLDDKENEKEIKSWLVTELDYLKNQQSDRERMMQRNIAMYKGIQYFSQETRQSQRDREGDRAKATPKIVSNQIYDLTEQKVARIIKYRPAVAILPTNDDFKDKLAAKTGKLTWDHIKYLQKFDLTLPNAIRMTHLCGEHYRFITWDPDLGSVHPDFPNSEVPLLDDQGEPMKDDLGKTIMIEKPVRIGDVKHEIVMPNQVYCHKAPTWEEVEYIFRVRVMDTDKLKRKYPKSKDQIKPDAEKTHFSFERMEEVKLVNQTLLIEFYHKDTAEMPGGRQIKWTKDCILENRKLPYSHGELPCERLVDIEVPGELHGISFIQMIKQLATQFNNLTSMIVRNQLLAAPKWMVPAGSVKLESLGNDFTLVQYKGPNPPILTQASPTGTEYFTFRENLKNEMAVIAGVHPVSRGEPPAGITAAVALQFLNEQESERNNAMVALYNEYIRRVAAKTISVAADYYDVNDQRTLMILGDNNQWMAAQLDPKLLATPFDIRIQNSSALPESKAAKIQTIIDLNQSFPGLMTQEQVLDMIDFAQSEKFVDEATASIRAAQSENEEMINNKDVAAPTEWERHIHHWNAHVAKIQERSFKAQVPQEIQQRFFDHIMAHEYLMMKAAEKNPMFQQQLATLNQFPMFFDKAMLGMQSPQSPQLPMGDNQSPMPERPENLAPPVPPLQPEGEPIPSAMRLENTSAI